MPSVTTMLPRVSVPVLSEQITDTEPRVSTVLRLSQTLPRRVVPAQTVRLAASATRTSLTLAIVFFDVDRPVSLLDYLHYPAGR